LRSSLYSLNLCGKRCKGYFCRSLVVGYNIIQLKRELKFQFNLYNFLTNYLSIQIHTPPPPLIHFLCFLSYLTFNGQLKSPPPPRTPYRHLEALNILFCISYSCLFTFFMCTAQPASLFLTCIKYMSDILCTILYFSYCTSLVQELSRILDVETSLFSGN